MPEEKDKKTSDIKDTSLLETGQERSSLYNHAQKLTTAVYLVTGLFPNDEPLKWHLRAKSIYLLSDLADFESAHIKKTRMECADKVVRSIHEIMSFINMGSIAEIISPMNKDIIVREYTALLHICKEIIEAHSKNVEGIVSNFFNFNDRVTVLPEKSGKEISNRQNLKDIQKVQRHIYTQSSRLSQVSPTTDGNKKSVVPEGQERREKILSIIKDKKRVTLRDVTDVIHGCSEKTLQRDLLDLVLGGILKKEGERRWTVYSLAEQPSQ